MKRGYYLFGLALGLVVIGFLITEGFGTGMTWNLVGDDNFKECADCNVLVILTDTLRYDHLGCYGYSKNTSPNINALCEEGVVFEEAISQATVTRESVVSLFISVYAQNHGIRLRNDANLSQNATTLAEVLKLNGYRTAAFLRNRVVDREDILQGFDESELFWEREGHLDENATESALNWLDKNKNDKFFVYLHYFAPHSPYNPPEGYAEKFRDEDYNETINFSDFERTRDINQLELTDDDVLELRSRYDGEINYMDNEVGKVINYLKENNLLDKTIIIFLADHGEGLAEKNGFVGHGAGINTVVQVPLIIFIPEERPKRYKKIVELIDIGPTILDSLGLEIPDNFKGEIISRRSYFKEIGFSITGNMNTLLRSNDYIFVKSDRFGVDNDSFDLFNIKEDPFELNNLNESETELYTNFLEIHNDFLNLRE